MIDILKLRKIIGYCGIALPILVLFLSLIFGYGFPKSISATYYIPNCITPFMIILGSASMLLLCYDGYDIQDKIVCKLAGISGFGICIFPCSNIELGAVGTFSIPQGVSGILHNICAVIFFGLLAYNSIFLFTKSNGNMTREKKRRNLIYKVCGIVMIGSFILLIPFNLLSINNGIWIVEAIALLAFGISWLTKSDSYKILFKDNKQIIIEESEVNISGESNE